MKNKISIIALSALMLLAACGSANTASAGGNTDSGSAAQGTAPNGQANNRQVERADLIGEVSTVSGNNITLKLMEMPSFNGNGAPQQGYSRNGGRQGAAAGNSNSGSSGNTGNPADDSSAKPSVDGKTARPSGGNGQGGGQGRQWSPQYTGETKTLTIPDGLEISSAGRGPSGDSSQQSLTVSDIKTGNILEIWYSDKEKETISKISIMQSMPGAGRGPSDASAGNASDNSNSK